MNGKVCGDPSKSSVMEDEGTIELSSKIIANQPQNHGATLRVRAVEASSTIGA
jgi:hypothetical protein